jgi:hypothetical protein
MKDDVVSGAGKGQSESLPQTMGGAGYDCKGRHGSIINAPFPHLPHSMQEESIAEEIGDEEPNIGRTLRKAAHEVRIPV